MKVPMKTKNSENSPVGEFEKRRGAWYGLAIGDALGAPVKFMTGEAIEKKHGKVTEMMAGGPWKKGEWTDDTALAIAIAAAYRDIEKGFDLDAAAFSMVNWLKSKPKDVGNQTRLALGLLDEVCEIKDWPSEMLRRKRGGAGNGSLMRAAPTGLTRKPDDPRLAGETADLSWLTHPDDRCSASCIAFNVALSSLVHEGPDFYGALAGAATAVRNLNK